MRRRLFIALLCSAPFTLASCSEPPTKERRQADEAFAAAKAAGAAVYAADDLDLADAALKKYDEAVTQRDYRQALNLAIEARDRAHAASRTAAERRAEARAAAERQIVDYERLVASGKTRLSATGPSRLRPPASDRVRAAVRNAPGLLQEARRLMQGGDFRGASKLLDPAIRILRQDLAAPAPRAPRTAD